MNKSMKIWAGALALTLLAGCGGAKTAESPAPTLDPNDTVYQVAGVTRNAPLANVDGREIQAEQLLFWLSSAIQAEEYYSGTIEEDKWAELGDQLKSDALDTATLYRVVETKAGEYGVTLTQEQEEEVAADVAAAAEQAGGEEAFRAVLEEACISKEGYTALSRVGYLYAGLRSKLEEDGTIAVTDSDIDKFIEENGIYAAKHILISTRRKTENGYEEFSDEEKAQALEKANGLRDQLAQAGNSEELFDQLMKEHSEDGRDENGDLYAPDGYTYVTPGRMVTGFEEGATALEIGEISDPIQTQFGYHIILRIPVDREQAKNQYNADYKMKELVDQWIKEAKVTTAKAWDELDPKEFHEKLAAIAEAHAPVETPAPETTESTQPDAGAAAQP